MRALWKLELSHRDKGSVNDHLFNFTLQIIEMVTFNIYDVAFEKKRKQLYICPYPSKMGLEKQF